MAWNEPGPNRDPWNQGPGGNKRGDGPPDLDEMLRRLKARLSGKGPRTPGGSSSGVPKALVGLVAALVAGLWLSTGFYVVDEQERGVVMRFGAYARTTDPGWGWHAPWPAEKVEIVNVTQVRQANDRATMLTKDENIVDVELTVQYRVSSAEQYLFSVADPDMTLRQATKSAVRETVGRSEMDFIITEGRQAVADRTKQLLQDRLDMYKCGLIVTEVNLQQAQPPEAVQSAFADAIKAREDQQRVKNEAEAYANDRLPRARGAAARQLEEASAYRDQVVARAEGDASRFSQLVAEYRKAPKVTRDRLYLDTMTQVLSQSSKVLIDVKQGNPMFYLPLDQLLKNSPKADEYDFSNSSGSGANRAAPNPQDSGRTRDRGRQ
ncbi:FtsH protease activity modulator HflK [Hydrocarboniphaga effusa]|jgi:membrane protease subunit HflK|uniref:FtsH protease activity modulator HflK n=1 Tax=Hydrocarboniphaga effusa TaxID=243629 RepID=UPI003137C646